MNTMNADRNDEKRRFHRILYTADANLTFNRQAYPCKVLDLSLRGCLLHFEHPWTEAETPEALYTLVLQLSDDIAISMELTVSHVDGSDVGFKCEHIDLESISQLRRLVELNLGDSVLLERDLVALSNPDVH